MDTSVKQEPVFLETIDWKRKQQTPDDVIELSSSVESDWDEEAGEVESKRKALGEVERGDYSSKRVKSEDGAEYPLPLGFLDPLPHDEPVLPLPGPPLVSGEARVPVIKKCRQFWKAGDYEGSIFFPEPASVSAGMDRVRVHPKFLHSNATSHKWALGAFAELMDNALDEVCNGATFVNIDMLVSKKDGSKMLLFEDNGGGMAPDKMRQCMSLGYSVKSKLANTIGQYGNGFKTSTMRLGADVIVFSRCRGKNGKSATQSIGLLSYTFLSSTGKEDIVVPMLDYEKGCSGWNKMMRSSFVDWNNNLETIVQWSPYSSEEDLLQQFQSFTDQGTHVVIFNLWEDDQGALELDFNTNKEDIQLGGVNRDEKNIEMAAKFPNSRHFLTYQHSLRSYASILYLRLPANFRMILRGKEIERHNIVDDMMKVQEVTYKPQHVDAERSARDSNLVAVVTIGFVKDAKNHLDVQGFNVYHKNRLIKPFWRVWNASGSDGRGVIGVLEANFIEPAHDKQGFERTIVLSRLEARLVQMQKQYWSRNCQVIGYAPRVNKKLYIGFQNGECSHEECVRPSPQHTGKDATKSRHRACRTSDTAKFYHNEKYSPIPKCDGKSGRRTHVSQSRLYEQSTSDSENDSEVDPIPTPKSNSKEAEAISKEKEDPDCSHINQLKEENNDLRERLKKMEGSMLNDIQLERVKNKSLQERLQAAEKKLEVANKEQEALIDIFSEERCRRDREEETLRKKLKDASVTRQELLQKLSSTSRPQC